MKTILIILSGFLLTSCWPTSVSFVDGSMPEEWKTFSVKNLEGISANIPLEYPANLSETLKDAIQNGSRLTLNTNPEESEVSIEGKIMSYLISPIALQEGDNAAQNKLTISVSFDIFISKPEEDQMNLTSTRFATYDSNQDLSSIEAQLLEEINEQIVQDVINKLMSNW